MRRQLRFVAPLALAAMLVPAITIAADSDAELADKETCCPAEVPMRRVAAFIRARA
mgnify:CR=1 FL=1